MLAIEYCTRAIIRYLNGDMDLFEEYTAKAIKVYKQQKCIVTIGEMVPVSTKIKMYEMVS